jgi:hypothetical protein
MGAIVLDMLGIQGSWTEYIKRQSFPHLCFGES